MPKGSPASSKTRHDVMAINEKQRKGRAANAVAELLVRKLLVPKVYMGPKGLRIFLKPEFELNENPWVDVLAIDRAGSGDTHGVMIDLSPRKDLDQASFEDYLKFYIAKAAIHFKYIAVDTNSIAFISKQGLFADDGIGRIGIIEVIENPSGPPEAKIIIPPERFRVKRQWIEEFDRFQRETPADMEIRG
ncbi:MAG TPA: hypothetical protein VMV98_01915 [Acidobacteriaceae bacterium]|nr:hypothetical protein [Acidobacteriaceae bacterium]